MELRIVLDIEGIPKGQPRTKARAYQPKNGGAVRAMVYTPSTASAWRAAIQAAIMAQARRHLVASGPVDLSVTFKMPRPKSLQTRSAWMRREVPHTTKPDADNLAKAVMDELTQAGVWRDDAQVARLLAVKRYIDAGERPGARVLIWF